MAPLYPLLLAAFLRLFGVSFALLYVVQHAIVVAAAAILATVTRRFAGDRAALAAAAFALLYHPLMYFASRPLGEPVPLLLLAAALLPPVPASGASSAVAGAAIGAASLGRPNLLLGRPRRSPPWGWAKGLCRRCPQRRSRSRPRRSRKRVPRLRRCPREL